MLNEVQRMQKLAGILKESGLGAAYAERKLDGDASRQMHERWSDDEEGESYDNYKDWDEEEREDGEFDPFGDQSFLDADDESDFLATIAGKKKQKASDSDIENAEDPYDFSDYGLDSEEDSGFNFNLTDKEKNVLGKMGKSGKSSDDVKDDGNFSIGGDSKGDARMGFTGNLDDYISKFLPALQKDKDANRAERNAKAAQDREQRKSDNIAIDRRTDSEKSTSRSKGIYNKRAKNEGIFEQDEEENNWNMDDYAVGDWVKSSATGEGGQVVGYNGSEDSLRIKNPYGKIISIHMRDVVADPYEGPEDNDHYGDDEDDLSYFTRRGWKSSMEEDMDPQAKMDKLAGLEEGDKSDFETFMSAMGELYGLSNSGFITPEEWKQLFPVYTAIYTRAKEMDVKHFKNDK